MKSPLHAVLALLFVTIVAAAPAAAQRDPTSTVRIVVGFGPGSSADIVARLVAKHFEQEFGQPAVVENRPGNSSMLAAEAVARAPNDGHTLFMATVANTLNPAQSNAKFNLATDLAPVALLGVVPNVLVAHPTVPADDVRQLIALARSKGDSLTFGTSGAGTASHLAAELFNTKAGAKVLAVHYQGGSNQALPDLLAGRITLMFNVAATLAPHVDAGKLKALAVAQPTRAGAMPTVPTMDEAGLPGFDAGIWIGLLAPAGTPREVILRINAALGRALANETVRSRLNGLGFDAAPMTPDEFDAFMAGEVRKYTKIVKDLGLKLN